MAGHLHYSHRTRKKFPRVATYSTRNFEFQLRRRCPCKLSVPPQRKTSTTDRLKSPGNRLRLVSREPMKLLGRSSFVGSRYQPLRRVSTTLRQVLREFSEFLFLVPIPGFCQKISCQEAARATIASSLDPQHPGFCELQFM